MLACTRTSVACVMTLALALIDLLLVFLPPPSRVIENPEHDFMKSYYHICTIHMLRSCIS